MSTPARIVSLVNRYDNLCNPRTAARGLTPHEALSRLFAQGKGKFDATMLNSFIRMMGVYPAGSVVQLTDDRYAVVTAPSAGCSSDGTGRLLDTSTGLTWMTHPYFPSSGGQNQAQAETYCSGLGMRLPTKDEALGIAGTNRQTCAFPCGWVTWTSSLAGPGLAWRVSNGGGSEQRDVGYNVGTVLCVQ